MSERSENNVTTKHAGMILRLKSIAAKYGIDIPLVLLMVKGTVAPTVGIAIYQVDSVARHFSTIGYLIPIMSILTIPILPRARFIQNIVVTSVATCFAAAISLFAMWCAVKARENTTHLSGGATSSGPVPGSSVSPYNAAASANMGVWLFFEIWLANTFRAYLPQYFVPSIIFSIFINVTATYGTQFATMKEAESLVTRLLESFFAGFGISAATNLIIFPFTSREIVTKLTAGEIGGLKSALEAQSEYIASLSTRNLFGSTRAPSNTESRTNSPCNSLLGTKPWTEAETFSSILSRLTTLQAKSEAELRYARVEMAWSKLRSEDLETICQLTRRILLPVLSVESLGHMVSLIEKRGGWDSATVTDTDRPPTESKYAHWPEIEREQWNWIFDQLCGHFKQLHEAMSMGLDESLYHLGLGKRPAAFLRPDTESNILHSSLREKDLAGHLGKAIQQYITDRESPLKEWCASKGLDDPSQQSDATQMDSHLYQHRLSQLHLILNVDYLYISTARAILDLVKFAGSKVNDGTMRRRRLIFPNWTQLKKWAKDAVSREDSNLDYQEYSTRSGTVIVRLSNILPGIKDPEHNPPVSAWERSCDRFRAFLQIFGSQESVFGFRVAAATMVIAIICFLRNSQQFFIEQRLIWGSIMVAISMTRTAGSGVYGQFLRFGGTAIAMVASYIIWYIVDQKTPGIIVFFAISMFLYHFPLVKHPDTIVASIIGMITIILIVGYELQVKKIGIPLSTSNGQVYHPLYELSPYRLATVLAGLAVAFIFTNFPSVITVRHQLREDLGKSLYLLGNYYCAVHQTISLKIRGQEGDAGDERSAGRRLDKARSRLFAKEIILLEGIKKHRKFMSWEPVLGGRFPQKSYDKIIDHTKHILHYITMIYHVAESFERFPVSSDSQSSSRSWLNDFKQIVISLELTSRDVSATLSLVATAISKGRPLPPFLTAPEPVKLHTLVKEDDRYMFSSDNVCEPGYAAFASIQVASALLADDLEGLLFETKKLVGEENFGIDILPYPNTS